MAGRFARCSGVVIRSEQRKLRSVGGWPRRWPGREAVVVRVDEQVDLKGISPDGRAPMRLNEVDELDGDGASERRDVGQVIDVDIKRADGGGLGGFGLGFRGVTIAEGLSEAKAVGGDRPFREAV